ncbi:MAG: cobyric acid synthase, partial [Nitrospiria bacterium]
NKALRTLKWNAIQEGLETLSNRYELIVMEGAGSPAEVNLREFDLANMEVALHAGAPVLLVADIDKGGSLAAVVGTLALLSEAERARVRGFIFNKFRGDKRLFDPASDFLKQQTGLPTLGLIPFDPTLSLMEEDALRRHTVFNGDPEIDIAIVAHRHLSNFTDFDPLMLEPGVMLRFVQTPIQLGRPDAVMLPGSKNTMHDLRHHFDTGLAQRVRTLAKEGVPVVGICGGYQMMGKELFDPYEAESTQGALEGLNLLDVITEFQKEKVTRRVSWRMSGQPPFFGDVEEAVQGYEIHCGQTRPVDPIGNPAFFSTLQEDEEEGFVDATGLIFGTALHGLFENDAFRRRFVNVLRQRKGLFPLQKPIPSFREFEDEQIERWAAFVSAHLDLKTITRFMDHSK